MLNNKELINELKSGNSNKYIFFKEKIKEELKKYNIEGNDPIINDIFNKALETYTEDIKIPFLFHIKATVKNILFPKEDINTGIFTKYEYEIISLYLKKDNNKYLSKEEIITKSKCSTKEFLKIIDKLNNSESSEIIKVFPNYKDIIKDRKNYFFLKSTTLSDTQLSMLEYYTGALNNNPLSTKELSIKFNMSRTDITDELFKIFRILQRGNELEKFISKYPKAKKTLMRKAKYFNISLEKEKEKIVTRNVNNDKKEHLSKNNIKVLNVLTKTNGKLISNEEAIKEGFEDIFDLIKKRDKVYYKLKNSYILLEEASKMYPHCNIKGLLTRPSLNERDIKILMFLENTHNEILTDEEKAIKGHFKSVKAYKMGINKFYAKLNKNNILIDEAMIFYKDLDLSDKPITLSNEDIKLITLLSEHKGLSGKKLAVIGGYRDDTEFNNKKYQLLKKIDRNKALEKKIKDEYPDFERKNDRKKDKLTKGNIEMISLLVKHKDNPISSKEMAKELGIINANSYNASKTALYKQLKNNETLKREALTLFPDFTIEGTVNGLTTRYTKNEIIFLQEFCLVKNNELIYQSPDTICKNLNIQPTTFEMIKKSSTIKVVKNMIVGTNLDLILWPNFTNEFITRDTFKEENSIELEEDDLNYIDKPRSKDNLLNALIALDNSIFNDYVRDCNDIERIILALRLGYFNKKFFTAKEVANILNEKEEKIIFLTKECLKASKNNYIDEKQKQKILI